MKRVRWILLSAATATLLGGVLHADESYRGYGSGYKHGEFQGKPFRDKRGGMMGMLFSLDLSDTQKEKIEKLMVENRYRMKGLWQDTRQDALNAALEDDGFNKKSYIEASKTRAAKRAEAMAEHLEKVMAVLTTAQRKALKAKIEKGEFPRPGFGPRR